MKTVDISEAIADSDLKSSRSRHLFLTLAKGSEHTKIQTGFSKKLLKISEPNFV